VTFIFNTFTYFGYFYFVSKNIERIRKQVESSPFIYKRRIIQITISSGLTKYKEGSLENFIKGADQAKENGRNKLIVV